MLPPAVRIYVARDGVDMRKSFDGLAALTQFALGEDPLTGHLYVFRNRMATLLKILGSSPKRVGLFRPPAAYRWGS
jgi:transposase